MNMLEQLKNAGRVTADKMIGRVILTAYGREWLTLRDLEERIYAKYGHGDTQSAISARIRDIKKQFGTELMLEKRTERINNKTVWFYRVVPAPQQPQHKEAA